MPERTGRSVPTRIPDRGRRRYAGRSGDKAGRARASGTAALRAFADDLIETGDPRLALDRAFRWGYRDDDGEHVRGLQEQLQDLQHQRDRLLRQIDHAEFLGALKPDLDELDAMDGRGASRNQAMLDRLADRLEAGYESEQARAGLESLRQQVAESLGADARGRGQPGRGQGAMRDARSARVDRLRKMLFAGGIEDDNLAEGEWVRGRAHRPSLRDALFDLELLRELERVESALATIDTIGSVSSLPDAAVDELRHAGMDDLADWLEGWDSVAASTLDTGSTASGLPPGVVRAISRDLLRGLFRSAASPLRGEHAAIAAGTAGDPSEGLLRWSPGRPLDLDLVATVSSAVRSGRADAGRVRLDPDDFQVIERGSSVSVSTVLAIDRSRSMGQGGGWVAARKVALALHELIQQSYPRDSLDVIAFSAAAERIDIGDVPLMTWDRFEHGTHLQGALALARRMLGRSRSGTRQVVVITDGEPTLATVHGSEIFASPPSAEVLEATMAEVIRCTREGVTINLVMLDDAGGGFAEQVARVNRGRIFRASSETLGSYVLRDYMSR